MRRIAQRRRYDASPHDILSEKKHPREMLRIVLPVPEPSHRRCCLCTNEISAGMCAQAADGYKLYVIKRIEQLRSDTGKDCSSRVGAP